MIDVKNDFKNFLLEEIEKEIKFGKNEEKINKYYDMIKQINENIMTSEKKETEVQQFINYLKNENSRRSSRAV